jgi:arsenate reductase-like glutaredoxin family protein
MSVTRYHNPRGAKSRQALAWREARGIKPRIILKRL